MNSISVKEDITTGHGNQEPQCGTIKLSIKKILPIKFAEKGCFIQMLVW